MITNVIENGKVYYDFKSLCNVLSIEPANRTRLGRLVKSSSIRVIEMNEAGKELSYAYTSEEGILIMLNEFKGLAKILKAFKLHKLLYGTYLFDGFMSFIFNKKINYKKAKAEYLKRIYKAFCHLEKEVQNGD